MYYLYCRTECLWVIKTAETQRKPREEDDRREFSTYWTQAGKMEQRIRLLYTVRVVTITSLDRQQIRKMIIGNMFVSKRTLAVLHSPERPYHNTFPSPDYPSPQMLQRRLQGASSTMRFPFLHTHTHTHPAATTRTRSQYQSTMMPISIPLEESIQY